MGNEFLLAAFIMAVGLCVAGAGTHLYQALAGERAMLRYDGKTFLRSLGHLAMSFLCGPYIMLQLGWQKEQERSVELTSALVAALVAFGWAFITGLLFVGLWVAVAY